MYDLKILSRTAELCIIQKNEICYFFPFKFNIITFLLIIQLKG